MLSLSSPAIQKKCHVLCADLALASGEVDEGEDELLESLREVLGVDDVLASKIVAVLSLKYAR